MKNIIIKNAYANNLKNIDVEIPIGKITSFTGVSGSGKSSLLKNILASHGYNNFSRISNKTVSNSLKIESFVKAEKIENMPNSILIDVKSSISNPASTVSTVSGIHETLRNLFVEFGELICNCCGEKIKRDFNIIEHLSVDLRIDDSFQEAITFIEENGKIISISYFDKEGKVTNIETKKSLATIVFQLKKITEKSVIEFNNLYKCRIKVFNISSKREYDFIREIECNKCHKVFPSNLKGRYSFTTLFTDGGGACKCCSGRGKISYLDKDSIFKFPQKCIFDGASNFISSKGIKYTTITEKFIEAVYKQINEKIDTPIEKLSKKSKNILLYGYDNEITFCDRTGGKKCLKYEGIISYLLNAYNAGKGKDTLHSVIEEKLCEECKGTRIDKTIWNIKLLGMDIGTLLNYSLSDLGKWCNSIKKNFSSKPQQYIEKIIKEIENFNKLSCGHLALYRSSNTLSGGELQRIRVCALLNSNISNMCYLLDEPSSGLHYCDIEKLGKLLQEMVEKHNTVIMVEHNKKLLQYSDYIVDLGPFGGNKGGKVLFSDDFCNIFKYKTQTTNALSTTFQNALYREEKVFGEYVDFKNLTYNNLKNISVKFPKEAFTTICGISGSGKSTFIKNAVIPSIEKNPQEYGFEKLIYLSQEGKVATTLSNVATLLDISTYIAQLYEKKSKIKKSSFLLSSKDGKCKYCGGTGKIYSDENEVIGICDYCNGIGFSQDVIKVKIDGVNIYDIYNTSLEELGDIIGDKKINSIAKACMNLGVGYLTLSRTSKSLSKGERQRISLVPILLEEYKDTLIIMDEPSKGLHPSDSIKLINSIKQIVDIGNTIVVVEHNPDLIQNSDYVIEFGGTGQDGGYLLYQGNPKKMSETPTSEIFIKPIEIKKIVADNDDNQIEIYDNSLDKIDYKLFNTYKIKDEAQKELLTKAARRSRDNFLSVAISNNSMFSKVDSFEIETKTPLILDIDFHEKIKYNISLYNALGISDVIKKIAVIENGSSIAQYIFDDLSSTGKCYLCKGIGHVFSVKATFFKSNNELTSECKKFLKNSTNFSKISKFLKKDGIDITKSDISKMNKEEKTSLFWGKENLYEIDGKNDNWKGIIPSFIEYHNYYSEKEGEEIFRSRVSISCPICNGERVKNQYANMKVCNLTFSEWQGKDIDEIDNILIRAKNNETIAEYIHLLNLVGLGKHKLGEELISLDANEAAMIKLLSLYFNRIYGAGIIIRNFEGKKINLLQKIFNNLSETNTLWIM